MGVDPLLGQRPEHRAAHYQCQGRDDHNSACIQGGSQYRRCLVPADAFYEWQKLDAKTKQPFAIAMKDGQPYALAGLWEKWKDRKVGEELLTFTVITTDPKLMLSALGEKHHRDRDARHFRP